MARDSEPEGRQDREYTESSVSLGFIIGIVVIVIATIFVFQNSDDTEVEFLTFTGTVPLAAVIVISLVLGAVLGWFVGFIRRRRRSDDK